MVRLTLIAIALLSLCACDTTMGPVEEQIDKIKECGLLLDSKPLAPEDRGSTCTYYDVYELDDELYSICNCCVCFKAVIPLNCSGEPLYTPVNAEKLQVFIDDADYLYSVAFEL